jgi:hypothetical protein
MPSDRRAAPREPLELQLLLGDGLAVATRDLSEKGVYVHVDAGPDLPPCLMLELWTARLCAVIDTDVVRREVGPFRKGAALKILRIRLRPLPDLRTAELPAGTP